MDRTHFSPCVICLEPLPTAMACERLHSVCRDCWGKFVNNEIKECRALSLCCPVPKCPQSTYAVTGVEKACGEALFRRYCAARETEMRTVASKDARECPRCFYGPYDFGNCDSLRSHHLQAMKGSGVNNACPRCGFFADCIAQWPKWSGRLDAEIEPMKVVQLPLDEHRPRAWDHFRFDHGHENWDEVMRLEAERMLRELDVTYEDAQRALDAAGDDPYRAANQLYGISFEGTEGHLVDRRHATLHHALRLLAHMEERRLSPERRAMLTQVMARGFTREDAFRGLVAVGFNMEHESLTTRHRVPRRPMDPREAESTRTALLGQRVYQVARRDQDLFLRHRPSGGIVILNGLSGDGRWLHVGPGKLSGVVVKVDGTQQRTMDVPLVPADLCFEDLTGVVVRGTWLVALPQVCHARVEDVDLTLKLDGFEWNGNVFGETMTGTTVGVTSPQEAIAAEVLARTFAVMEEMIAFAQMKEEALVLLHDLRVRRAYADSWQRLIQQNYVAAFKDIAPLPAPNPRGGEGILRPPPNGRPRRTTSAQWRSTHRV